MVRRIEMPFLRVSAISFSGASFLPILFWQDRKEWAAGGIPHRLVQKNEPPEASRAIPAQKER
jgi:hypothetical protein